MRVFARCMLACIGSLCAAAAMAGDIVGTVTGGAAVVWLEGDLPARPQPAPVSIVQRGVQFTPSLAAVMVGQEILLPNDDNVAHNVYSISPAGRFNLGVYPKGESRSLTLAKPGLVEMRCWLHERMKAAVVVVPNAFYAVAESGTFRIASVPSGTYRLVMYRKDGVTKSTTISVPPSGVVRSAL